MTAPVHPAPSVEPPLPSLAPDPRPPTTRASLIELPANLRLLVVDDNMVNREVLCLFLEELGYAPHSASNGLEAFEQARATQFDLIFMDIHMPELDGISATRLIRQHESAMDTTQPAVIIALTADICETDQEKCRAAGMNDYLAKPLRAEKLPHVLARHLCHR